LLIWNWSPKQIGAQVEEEDDEDADAAPGDEGDEEDLGDDEEEA
jgi:hypothetical protein